MRWTSISLAVLLTACAAGPQRPDAAVRLTEFGIDVPDTIGAEPVVIPVHNDGEFTHTLVISTLDGDVVTATDVIAPGDSAELDVDLAAGEYRFTCRIVVETESGEIVDHYARGMIADVEVRPET